jgi:hypothetical protein
MPVACSLPQRSILILISRTETSQNPHMRNLHSFLIGIGVLALASVQTAQGGSATWRINASTGDWNTAANWDPATVPNGVADEAIFDVSSTTTVSLSAATAEPIGGTFVGLADGSTRTIGTNKLEVSYEGGDGNDLTLTVVP